MSSFWHLRHFGTIRTINPLWNASIVFKKPRFYQYDWKRKFQRFGDKTDILDKLDKFRQNRQNGQNGQNGQNRHFRHFRHFRQSLIQTFQTKVDSPILGLTGVEVDACVSSSPLFFPEERMRGPHHGVLWRHRFVSSVNGPPKQFIHYTTELLYRSIGSRIPTEEPIAPEKTAAQIQVFVWLSNRHDLDSLYLTRLSEAS